MNDAKKEYRASERRRRQQQQQAAAAARGRRQSEGLTGLSGLIGRLTGFRIGGAPTAGSSSDDGSSSSTLADPFEEAAVHAAGQAAQKLRQAATQWLAAGRPDLAAEAMQTKALLHQRQVMTAIRFDQSAYCGSLINGPRTLSLAENRSAWSRSSSSNTCLCLAVALTT